MNEPEAWDVDAMLCDSAQVAEGKLYILGGGWSVCGPGPFVHGIAVKLAVPWNETNRRHVLTAVLLSEDGAPVAVGEPPSDVTFRSEFELGRPPGLPPGTPLDMPMAVNFGPLELPADQGFAWSIRVNEVELDRVRFRTRSRRAPGSRGA